MKFYDEYYTTYYNGEKIDAYVNMVCADEIPEDRTIEITWSHSSVQCVEFQKGQTD